MIWNIISVLVWHSNCTHVGWVVRKRTRRFLSFELVILTSSEKPRQRDWFAVGFEELVFLQKRLLDDGSNTVQKQPQRPIAVANIPQNIVGERMERQSQFKNFNTSLPNSSELWQPPVCCAAFFGRRGHFPLFQVLQHRQEVLKCIFLKNHYSSSRRLAR